MYTAVIIDDEEILLNGLKYEVDWNSIGIEIIGTANGGDEGLELICEKNPDIVMSDIRMSSTSGLDMIEVLKNTDISPKVVFITGYGDFGYTKKAIQLGAFDYILKPINLDEISNTLKRCIEKIESEKKAKVEKQELISSLMEMQKSYVHQLVKNYILGYEKDTKPLSLVLSQICVNALQWRFTIAIVGIQDLIMDSDETENTDYEKVFDLINMRFLSSNTIIFENKPYVIFLLMKENVDDKEFASWVQNICEKVILTVYKDYGFYSVFGIGGICQDITSVSQSYLEAQKAYFYSIFGYGKQIISIGEVEEPNEPLIADVEEKLFNYIKIGDKESIDDFLKKMFLGFSATENLKEVIRLKLLCLRIINFLTSEMKNDKQHLLKDISLLYHEIEDATSVQNLYNKMKKMLHKIINIHMDSDKNIRGSIKKAIDYIDKNYSNPITLQEIANEVFLSSSRFSTVFNEEVGESFSRYLTRKRIEKAKELLKNPYTKIYEVANSVGYNDARYFSTIFKKLEGITPVQYINSL